MTKSQEIEAIESTDVWLREYKVEKLYTFHCNDCGFILFQHVQGVKLVIPGVTYSNRDYNKLFNKELEGDHASPPFIIRCKNCKKQYNIR